MRALLLVLAVALLPLATYAQRTQVYTIPDGPPPTEICPSGVGYGAVCTSGLKENHQQALDALNAIDADENDEADVAEDLNCTDCIGGDEVDESLLLLPSFATGQQLPAGTTFGGTGADDVLATVGDTLAGTGGGAATWDLSACTGVAADDKLTMNGANTVICDPDVASAGATITQLGDCTASADCFPDTGADATSGTKQCWYNAAGTCCIENVGGVLVMDCASEAVSYDATESDGDNAFLNYTNTVTPGSPAGANQVHSPYTMADGCVYKRSDIDASDVVLISGGSDDVCYTSNDVTIAADGTIAVTGIEGVNLGAHEVYRRNAADAAMEAYRPLFAVCKTLYAPNEDIASDTIFSIFRAHADLTLTEIWCEVQQPGTENLTVQLQNDDGIPADVMAAVIDCDGGTTDAGWNGTEEQVADGDTLDLVLVATNTPSEATVCFEYTLD